MTERRRSPSPKFRSPEEWLQHWAQPVTESGCWIFDGAIGVTGYGWVNYRGRKSNAHRASWRAFNGPIPAGLYVLHRCDVRCCVNPSHLFLGTQTDNMRDMNSKGRHATGRIKTHCPQGHEYATVPWMVSGLCRICQRQAKARYNAKRKQARISV